MKAGDALEVFDHKTNSWVAAVVTEVDVDDVMEILVTYKTGDSEWLQLDSPRVRLPPESGKRYQNPITKSHIPANTYGSRVPSHFYDVSEIDDAIEQFTTALPKVENKRVSACSTPTYHSDSSSNRHSIGNSSTPVSEFKRPQFGTSSHTPLTKSYDSSSPVPPESISNQRRSNAFSSGSIKRETTLLGAQFTDSELSQNISLSRQESSSTSSRSRSTFQNIATPESNATSFSENRESSFQLPRIQKSGEWFNSGPSTPSLENRQAPVESPKVVLIKKIKKGTSSSASSVKSFKSVCSSVRNLSNSSQKTEFKSGYSSPMSGSFGENKVFDIQSSNKAITQPRRNLTRNRDDCESPPERIESDDNASPMFPNVSERRRLTRESVSERVDKHFRRETVGELIARKNVAASESEEMSFIDQLIAEASLKRAANRDDRWRQSAQLSPGKTEYDNRAPEKTSDKSYRKGTSELAIRAMENAYLKGSQTPSPGTQASHDDNSRRKRGSSENTAPRPSIWKAPPSYKVETIGEIAARALLVDRKSEGKDISNVSQHSYKKISTVSAPLSDSRDNDRESSCETDYRHKNVKSRSNTPKCRKEIARDEFDIERKLSSEAIDHLPSSTFESEYNRDFSKTAHSRKQRKSYEKEKITSYGDTDGIGSSVVNKKYPLKSSTQPSEITSADGKYSSDTQNSSLRDDEAREYSRVKGLRNDVKKSKRPHASAIDTSDNSPTRATSRDSPFGIGNDYNDTKSSSKRSKTFSRDSSELRDARVSKDIPDTPKVTRGSLRLKSNSSIGKDSSKLSASDTESSTEINSAPILKTYLDKNKKITARVLQNAKEMDSVVSNTRSKRVSSPTRDGLNLTKMNATKQKRTLDKPSPISEQQNRKQIGEVLREPTSDTKGNDDSQSTIANNILQPFNLELIRELAAKAMKDSSGSNGRMPLIFVLPPPGGSGATGMPLNVLSGFQLGQDLFQTVANARENEKRQEVVRENMEMKPTVAKNDFAEKAMENKETKPTVVKNDTPALETENKKTKPMVAKGEFAKKMTIEELAAQINFDLGETVDYVVDADNRVKIKLPSPKRVKSEPSFDSSASGEKISESDVKSLPVFDKSVATKRVLSTDDSAPTSIKKSKNIFDSYLSSEKLEPMKNETSRDISTENISKPPIIIKAVAKSGRKLVRKQLSSDTLKGKCNFASGSDSVGVDVSNNKKRKSCDNSQSSNISSKCVTYKNLAEDKTGSHDPSTTTENVNSSGSVGKKLPNSANRNEGNELTNESLASVQDTPTKRGGNKTQILYDSDSSKPFKVIYSDGTVVQESIVVRDSRLPKGWYRHAIRKRNSNRWNIVVFSSDGKQIYSRKELHRYLSKTRQNYSDKMFDFSVKGLDLDTIDKSRTESGERSGLERVPEKLSVENSQTECAADVSQINVKMGANSNVKSVEQKSPVKAAESATKGPAEIVIHPVILGKRIKTLLPRSRYSGVTNDSNVSSSGADNNKLSEIVKEDAVESEVAIDSLECPSCLKSFRAERFLWDHVKYKHVEYESMMKDSSKRSFGSARSLTDHVLETSEREILSKILAMLRASADSKKDTAQPVESVQRVLTGKPRSMELAARLSGKQNAVPSKPKPSIGKKGSTGKLKAASEKLKSVGARKSVEDNEVGSEECLTPRRSARAKPKRIDEESESAPVTRGGSRAQSLAGEDESSRQVSPMKEVENSGNEVVLCCCYRTHERGLMMRCEFCLRMQHAACFGIRNEDEIPKNYICSFCKASKEVYSSEKYSYVDNWLSRGVLARYDFSRERQNEKMEKKEKLLIRSSELLDELNRLKNDLHCLIIKNEILGRTQDHPKLYLWSSSWDQKKVEEEEKRQKELMKNTFPVPEKAINTLDCRNNLSEHLDDQERILEAKINSLEQELDTLLGEDSDYESVEESDEEDAQVSRTLKMLSDDLGIVQNMKYCF